MYKVVRYAPKDKTEQMRNLEAENCIYCHGKNVYMEPHESGNTVRNHYICNDCGTEWFGESYVVGPWKPIRTKHLDFLPYLIAAVAFIFLIGTAFFLMIGGMII